MSKNNIRVEEITLEIVEKICKSTRDEIKRRFRSRTRDLLSNIYSNGVAHTISICAARSSAEAVEIGLSSSKVDDLVRMCKDAHKIGIKGDEELGYALYGASILYVLKTLGIVNANNLREAIKELLGNSLADKKAFQVGIWLKRFAEAYIHE